MEDPMKNTKKYFLSLFLFVLIFSAAAICSFAAETANESDSNYISVYNPSTGEYKYYASPNDLRTALMSAPDGAVVTLLRDVTYTRQFCYAGAETIGTAENKQDIYFDLNGKTLMHAYGVRGTFIDLKMNTHLMVYSSQEGAKILSSYPTNGTDGYSGYTMFNPRYNGSHLTIGTVTAPTVGQDGTVTMKTYSGDNLSTYSGQLVSNYYNKEDIGSTGNDAVVNITGGTHYSTHKSRGGLFLLENSIEVNAENAVFHVLDDSDAFINIDTNENTSITFDNCEIYAKNLITGSKSKCTATFNSCKILGGSAPKASNNVIYNDCTLSRGSIAVSGYYSTTYYPISYHYSYGVIDGTTPYTVKEATRYLDHYVDSLDEVETVEITWVIPNGSVTKTWFKSDNIIPVPPAFLDIRGDVSEYDFGEEILSTANGDKTYTLQTTKITWKTSNTSVSEYWCKSENVIPTPSALSDVYGAVSEYDFGEEILSTASGDKTYTLKTTKITWKTPITEKTEYWCKSENVIPTPSALSGVYGDVSEYDFGEEILSTASGDKTYTLKTTKITWKTSNTSVSEYWCKSENVIPTPPVFSGVFGDASEYDFDKEIVSTDKGNKTYILSTAEITWVTPKGTTIQYWCIGDNVFPTIPTFEGSSETVTYSLDKEILSTTESGSTTYTFTPRINFTVRANLELYADFVYKLYIPKTVGDSGCIISARIDRISEGGAVITGNQLKLEETHTINLVDYYVLRKSINATEGDTEYNLVLTVKGAYGETFTHTQPFSIPDYAKRVNDGNYAQNAKTMVNSAVTYIKAARNYAAEANETDLPYSDDNFDSLTEEASSEAAAAPSAAVKKSFYGISLSLESDIKFRFYMNKESTDTVTFSYLEGNGYKSAIVEPSKLTDTVTLTLGDGSTVNAVYYDISMKALYLRSTVKIDLKSTADIEVDYTYRLANYVNSQANASETLKTLMDAMFAYSKATHVYLSGSSSEDDTPSVDVYVADTEVTAENYVIVAADSSEKAAAEALQNIILEKTGEKLSIESAKTNGKSAIVFSYTAPNGDYDLSATVENGDIVIAYGLKSFINSGVHSFIEKNLRHISTEKTFDSEFNEVYTSSAVYYSDFGAAGDGETDDFAALYNAHVFANSHNKKVYADSGEKTYYIYNTIIQAEGETKASVKSIPIMTDTYWGDATIIIDDRTLTPLDSDLKPMISVNVFTVTSPYSSFEIKSGDARIEALGNIGEAYRTTKIDLGLGYPALLVISNSNHKVFRRSGASYFNAEDGTSDSDDQCEIILVDAEGNIDPSTPFMFDYTDITNIQVIRCDLDPLTVKGGTVITRACTEDAEYINEDGNYKQFGYFQRGLLINRSNTTIDGLKHVVTDEITVEQHRNEDKQGAHYNGFFFASRANNVKLYDCTLQGRRYYNAGTYDYRAYHTNNITLEKCVQSNFWINEDGSASPTDTGITSMRYIEDLPTYGDTKTLRYCWGVGATNFCKNMNYLNSRLSRFDAHCGLYNGSVIGCEINFFSLVGKGDFIIKDTTWYSTSADSTDNGLLYLRSDYGSTWDGEIKVQNLTAYVNYMSAFSIIRHSYRNWYYGYECAFPSLELDNLVLYNYKLGEDGTLDTSPIAAGTKIKFSNLVTEDIHLPETKNTAPIRIYYDETTGKYVQGTRPEVTGYVNDNPITPPEYIKFLNNEHGYNFAWWFEDYFGTDSTFLDDTYIFEGTRINGVVTVTNLINKGKYEEIPTISLDSPLISVN